MTHKRYQHKTIELCRDCAGKGYVIYFDEYDFKEENPLKKTCTTCQGSGRVLVSKKIETTIEPFNSINN